MSKLIFYIVLFLVSTVKFYGQQLISGAVYNAYDFPVSDASILLFQQNDTLSVKSYTKTNSNGEFNLSIPTDNNEYFFETSLFGYKSKKTKITSNTNYKVQLEEEVTKLQEIVITTTSLKDVIDLKRDTLKFKDNATLKDILKDNEGIEITNEDGIKYMGIPINKILINRKEVFVNQNSLAINNLTNEMIEKIQIVNNHRDKFNIDFGNFEETVINVDVKDNFRGAIKTDAEILGGYKYAFDINVKSMFFSDKINAFLIQNTNNINIKKANLSEINKRYSEVSTFYENNLNKIVQGEENVKKDLSNNTYFLLKRENEKFKSNLNFGYLVGKQNLINQTEVAQQSHLLYTEKSSMNQNGNLYYLDFNGSYLPDEDFSLFLNSKIDFLDNDVDWQINKTILPNNYLYNTVHNQNRVFLTKNTLGTKKMLSNKWLFDSELTHYFENANYHFVNTTSSYQKTQLKNNNFIAFSSLSYQHSSLLNVVGKIQYKSNNENIKNVAHQNNLFNRDYQHTEIKLTARGSNKKTNYFLETGTGFYSIKEKNKWVFPVSASFNYRISNNKSIYLSYDNNWHIESVENSLDSLYYGNNMLILGRDFSDNLSHNQSVVAEYNISNLAKSQGVSFIMIGNLRNNFTQLIIKDFSDNLTTYERLLLNANNSAYFIHSYSKGYYFSESDHQIKWKYNVGFNLSKGDVLYNNDYNKLTTKGYNIDLSLEFVFQNLFLTNLSLKNKFKNTDSVIDNSVINKISSNTTILYVDKIVDEYNFSVEAYRQHFFTENKSIGRYDLNLSAQYHLDKNLSVKLSGQSLFSLFKITNNRANISVNSNTGYNVTSLNDNILGYIMIGANYKF